MSKEEYTQLSVGDHVIIVGNLRVMVNKKIDGGLIEYVMYGARHTEHYNNVELSSILEDIDKFKVELEELLTKHTKTLNYWRDSSHKANPIYHDAFILQTYGSCFNYHLQPIHKEMDLEYYPYKSKNPFYMYTLANEPCK